MVKCLIQMFTELVVAKTPLCLTNWGSAWRSHKLGNWLEECMSVKEMFYTDAFARWPAATTVTTVPNSLSYCLSVAKWQKKQCFHCFYEYLSATDYLNVWLDSKKMSVTEWLNIWFICTRTSSKQNYIVSNAISECLSVAKWLTKTNDCTD